MVNQELLKKLYDTAFTNEEKYGGCAQCTIGSVKTHLGGVSDNLFQAATALAGGVAASGNTCGACTAGILALGTFLGRDFENFGTEIGIENKNKVTEMGRKLLTKFESEYGSFKCSDIHEKLYGNVYRMYVPEEKEQFIAAGGHGENGCTMVCGKAAQWVAEILDEEGLLK